MSPGGEERGPERTVASVDAAPIPASDRVVAGHAFDPPEVAHVFDGRAFFAGQGSGVLVGGPAPRVVDAVDEDEVPRTSEGTPLTGGVDGFLEVGDLCDPDVLESLKLRVGQEWTIGLVGGDDIELGVGPKVLMPEGDGQGHVRLAAIRGPVQADHLSERLGEALVDGGLWEGGHVSRFS